MLFENCSHETAEGEYLTYMADGFKFSPFITQPLSLAKDKAGETKCKCSHCSPDSLRTCAFWEHCC